MSETGTKDWLCQGVREGKTEPNPHGGNFQKFYVDFEGSPGTYWRRKEGNRPEPGQRYYGEIKEGNYGPMFSSKQRPDGATRASGSSDYSKRSQSNGKSADQLASIVRQHSQEMALRFLQTITTDPKGNSGTINFSGDWLGKVLAPIIDWFEADANRAAVKDALKESFPNAKEVPVAEGASGPMDGGDDIPFARPAYPAIFSERERGR